MKLQSISVQMALMLNGCLMTIFLMLEFHGCKGLENGFSF